MNRLGVPVILNGVREDYKYNSDAEYDSTKDRIGSICHIHDEGDWCEVEFSNDDGEFIACISAPVDKVNPVSFPQK